MTEHFRALDGWRGIAALSVALFHFSPWPMWGENRDAWALFVPFFFILSAFVLTHSVALRGSSSFGSYALRRVARLWPLHVVTFLAVPCVLIAKYWLLAIGNTLFGNGTFLQTTLLVFPHDIGDLIGQLFFLQYITPANGWIGPNWSISIEFWVSLAFFPIFIIGRRAALPVLLLGMLCAFALYTGDGFLGASDKNLHGVTGANFGVVTAIMCFAFGFASYHYRPDDLPRPCLQAAELLISASVVYVFVWLKPRDPEWALLLLVPIPLIFSYEAGPISKLLFARPIQWLGKVSYSIYLTHALVLMVTLLYEMPLARIPSETFQFHYAVWANKVIYVTAVLILSSLTHRFIERPAQRFLLSFSNRRRSGSMINPKDAQLCFNCRPLFGARVVNPTDREFLVLGGDQITRATVVDETPRTGREDPSFRTKPKQASSRPGVLRDELGNCTKS